MARSNPSAVPRDLEPREERRYDGLLATEPRGPAVLLVQSSHLRDRAARAWMAGGPHRVNDIHALACGEQLGSRAWESRVFSKGTFVAVPTEGPVPGSRRLQCARGLGRSPCGRSLLIEQRDVTSTMPLGPTE